MSLKFFSLKPSTPSPSTISSRIPLCGRCGLNLGCKTPRMLPAGKGEKRVLLVAEAPGEQEDERGIPLVGASGQKLRESLSSIGVCMNRDCWKTNAVICRPPKNRKPKAEEISGCRPWLFRTIEKLKPHVIVLLGSTALESLLSPIWLGDIGSMERWVGWTIPCQAPINCWVVPTWHPSFLLRMNQKVLDLLFVEHLKLAFGLLDSPAPTVRAYSREIRTERSPTAAAKALRRMSRDPERPIAFDYETTALKPETPNCRIFSCAASNGEETIAFPWLGEAKQTMIQILQSDIPKIGANIQFEDRWSRLHAGGPVRNWAWDTFLAAHVLDNRKAIAGLKFQAFVRFGVPIYDQSVEPFISSDPKTKLNRLADAELKDVLLYNGMDARITFDLAELQQRELDAAPRN